MLEKLVEDKRLDELTLGTGRGGNLQPSALLFFVFSAAHCLLYKVASPYGMVLTIELDENERQLRPVEVELCELVYQRKYTRLPNVVLRLNMDADVSTDVAFLTAWRSWITDNISGHKNKKNDWDQREGRRDAGNLLWLLLLETL